MTKEELQMYGLIETNITKEAAKASGEEVYEPINEPGYLVTTYDFLRGRTLPEGIWGVFYHDDKDGIYSLHINEAMLFSNPDSVTWGVSVLKLQKYLKEELDDK